MPSTNRNIKPCVTALHKNNQTTIQKPNQNKLVKKRQNKKQKPEQTSSFHNPFLMQYCIPTQNKNLLKIRPSTPIVEPQTSKSEVTSSQT